MTTQASTSSGTPFVFLHEFPDRPSVLAHAPQGLQPGLVFLRFDVSLNEEHVFLRLVHEGAVAADLGERAHHYNLLVLARLRLEDAQRGIDSASQGWVGMERLSRMLGLEPCHINIHIHRARRQLALAMPPALRQIDVVERRRGELRFGPYGIHIMRGARLEALAAGLDGTDFPAAAA